MFSKENLRLRRISLGLSQADLALTAGLSRSFLSQIESGKRKPGPQTLTAIADALDVAVEQLFAPADSVWTTGPCRCHD